MTKIKYKDYTAKIEYSEPDKVFWGKVLDITDTILFEGNTLREVKAAFYEAIDDYLIICEEEGMMDI